MINRINDLRMELLQLFISKTLQNTGVIFVGNIIASGFTLLTILILSRILGPEIFGTLSLVNSVTILLVSLTDLGIAVGLSKFVSPMKNKFSKEGISFFRVVFWVEFFLGFMTLLLGLIFLNSLTQLLGGAQIKEPLVLGLIIAGVLSFNAYVPIVLQVLQKFRTITILNILSNSLKLLLIVILLYTGYLTLWNTLYIYLLVAIVVLLVGFLIIPRFFTSKIEWVEDIKSLSKLFSFTKWLAISYGFNAIAARLDIILLSRFRSSVEIGHYALAFQLSSIFPLLLAAFSAVLIPKVNAFKTSDQIGMYILKSVRSSLLIIPLILIAVVVTPFLIKSLFGLRFINSIPILQILLLNYLLILIINPVSYVMYSLNKQKILSLMNATTLVTLFVMQLYLIPNFGGIGAALALFFNTIIAIIIFLFLFIIYHKQGKIRI